MSDDLRTIRLRRPEKQALERLFVASITHEIVQSKAKAFDVLRRHGLAELVTFTDHSKYGVLTVTHWDLTVRGHLYYCANAKPEPEEET